jgi:acetyltransferase-like isoleucine patch superfamily enzyme
VKISEGALIAMYSIVLPGVTIGKGSVVSAGSVVTKDVLPFTIVRGNPAELVGKVRMKPHELEEIKSVEAK